MKNFSLVDDVPSIRSFKSFFAFVGFFFALYFAGKWFLAFASLLWGFTVFAVALYFILKFSTYQKIF